MSPKAQTWLEAVARPPIADALEAVYTIAADQITARGPACWASGRCCNFEKTGHRLYVSGLEAAYAVSRLGAAVSAEEVASSLVRGDCPFLRENLCGIHAIKPLGCRVYFCDRGAEAWQGDLSERCLRLIREIHDRHAVPYRYGEWRAMLREFTTEG